MHGLFPGSATMLTQVRRDIRWEDFEYKYRSKTGNRFAYFGNGWTKKEVDEKADVTPYLRIPGDVDLKNHLEEWWTV